MADSFKVEDSQATKAAKEAAEREAAAKVEREKVEAQKAADEAAEAQALEDAEKDEVEVVEDPVASVELNDEFSDEKVTVSVANFPDLELVPSESYDVPVTQAQLLVETPAVRYAE